METAAGSTGLIDTDVLINAAHGRAASVSFLNAQRASGGIQISVISAMELVAGSRNGSELAKVREFLQLVRLLPLSESASKIAFDLMQAFFLSHGLLIPDALIAATALERGLSLYTRNARHFEMIPKLTVILPY